MCVWAHDFNIAIEQHDMTMLLTVLIFASRMFVFPNSAGATASQVVPPPLQQTRHQSHPDLLRSRSGVHAPWRRFSDVN